MSIKIMKRNEDYVPAYINYFDDIFGRNLSDFFFGSNDRITMPAANIVEYDKNFEIELAAPGYNKNDFKINIENKALVVKAEVNKCNEEKDARGKIAHREHYYASFERNFSLPANIDMDKIEANYKDGILHISLPKKDVNDAVLLHEIRIK